MGRPDPPAVFLAYLFVGAPIGALIFAAGTAAALGADRDTFGFGLSWIAAIAYPFALAPALITAVVHVRKLGPKVTKSELLAPVCTTAALISGLLVICLASWEFALGAAAAAALTGCFMVGMLTNRKVRAT